MKNMDTEKKYNFNLKLLSGIISFFLLDVLLVIQLVSKKDYLVKYNIYCAMITGLISFILVFVCDIFVKKNYEKKLRIIFLIIFLLFFILLLLNCKFVYLAF